MMHSKMRTVLVAAALAATTSLANVSFRWSSSAGQAVDSTGVNLPANCTVFVYVSADTTVNLGPGTGLRSSQADDVLMAVTHTVVSGRYTTASLIAGADGSGPGSYVGAYCYIVVVKTPYYAGITPESIPVGTEYGISSLSPALGQYDTVPPALPQTFVDDSDGDAIIRTGLFPLWPDVLAIAPAALTNAVSQGASAAAQTLEVWNSGSTNALAYTVTDDAAWLSVSPAWGTAWNGQPATLTLAYDTASLAPGTYGATVTVSAALAAASPRTLTVTLSVTSPPPVSVSQACGGYSASGTANVACSVAVAPGRELLSLLWRPTLPAGWVLAGASGAGSPQIRGNDIVLTGALTDNPLVFTYQATVPAGQTGAVEIRGEVEYMADGEANPSVIQAQPDPLEVSSRRTLTVATAHGVAYPAGTVSRNYGTVLTNRVTSPETLGTTQYVCTGWTMTGNEPRSGTDAAFTMTITNDAALTWLWEMQYRFEAGAEAGGSVTPAAGWYAAGVTVTATATASVGFVFTGWTWGEGSSSANPLELVLDRPRAVLAHFAIDPALIRAEQSCPGYRSPSAATTVEGTFAYPAGQTLASLEWRPALPAGWALAAGGTSVVLAGPFTNNPVTFSYAVQVPGDAPVTNGIGGTAVFRFDGMSGTREVASAPLAASRYHSADYRAPFRDIDGSEVNRVLAYWRAGTYHPDAAGYDGYASGPGAVGAGRHSSDFQAAAWSVDAIEAATALAYWRAGGYVVAAGSPDGYAALAGGAAGVPAAASQSTVTQMAAGGYDPGATVTITNTFTYAQPLLTLTWQPVLPPGWTVVAAAGDGNPELQHGALLWTGVLPPSPIRMTYTVSVPLTETGTRSVRSVAGYYLAGMTGLAQVSPEPSLLALSPNDGDGDGLADGWEQHYAGSATALLPGEDADHDGLSNIQEYLAGTDPTDAASTLAVQAATARDEVLLTWPSVANRTYAVGRGTNLVTGLPTLVTNIPATPPGNTFRDPTSGAPVLFYRVTVEP